MNLICLGVLFLGSLKISGEIEQMLCPSLACLFQIAETESQIIGGRLPSMGCSAQTPKKIQFWFRPKFCNKEKDGSAPGGIRF